MVKIVILCSNFMAKSKAQRFTILTVGNLFFGHGHSQNGHYCIVVEFRGEILCRP